MLSHVTFTGWDQRTDLHELAAFCGDYPQERIEVAVLYSANQQDADRYPLVEKARDILRTARAAGQRTAVHICGRAARSLLQDVEEDAAGIRVFSSAGPLISAAQRVQVNVGEEFWPDGDGRYKQAWLVARAIGRPVIVQSRSIGGWPDVEHFGPGASRMVPFLFDRSAGTGAAPIDWPLPRANLLVGYAGGLGPDNVADLCASIAGARIDGSRWWLDMESRIRAPFALVDRRADEPPTQTFVSIDRCRQVMRAVAPWLRS